MSARALAPIGALILGFGLFGLWGCGELVRVKNLPPEVAFAGLCTSGERVFLEFTTQDLEENDVDLDVRFHENGKLPEAEPAIVVGPEQDGVLGLRTDRDFPGKHHWAEWAACADPNAQPLTEASRGSCVAVTPETDMTGAPPSYVGMPGLDKLGGLKFDVVVTDTHDNTVTLSAQPGTALGECDFAQGAHE